jgi:hypothetical protein
MVQPLERNFAHVEQIIEFHGFALFRSRAGPAAFGTDDRRSFLAAQVNDDVLVISSWQFIGLPYSPSSMATVSRAELNGFLPIVKKFCSGSAGSPSRTPPVCYAGRHTDSEKRDG